MASWEQLPQAMASRKKNLGKYVLRCKEKYKREYSYLIHVSNAPHKVLVPNITDFAHQTVVKDKKNRIIHCDYERFQHFVFFSPPQEFDNWVHWCSSKNPKPNNNGYITLYAHVVRVSLKDTLILKNRYSNELVYPNSIAVKTIIPFRVYVGKRYRERPINRDKVLRKLDYIKKQYKYNQKKRAKIKNWFMTY